MKKKVLALNECEEVVTNQKVVNEENPKTLAEILDAYYLQNP